MGRKKQAKKDKKRHERQALSEEEQTQLQMLLDRVLAQDPERRWLAISWLMFRVCVLS